MFAFRSALLADVVGSQSSSKSSSIDKNSATRSPPYQVRIILFTTLGSFMRDDHSVQAPIWHFTYSTIRFGGERLLTNYFTCAALGLPKDLQWLPHAIFLQDWFCAIGRGQYASSPDAYLTRLRAQPRRPKRINTMVCIAQGAEQTAPPRIC
jgi:hypothetical protein